MLMDQQSIIHKQRETIEKKKHQLTKLKQKHTKTTVELEKKKQKQLNKLKKPNKNFKILCPLCRDKTFDLNNLTNYNRHLKKMQSSPRKEKSKRMKKIEKQKVKMYIFSTEYIFLKPKDQTNEHEQKKK